MLNLNLVNPENSNISYNISHFPDGEVQITLGEFSRKEVIEVRCRITNAEELFIIMQINDILTRHAVVWNLHIAYLMGMRMDRVMDFNRPFTLKIIKDILKGLGQNETYILEPHSKDFMENWMCFDLDPEVKEYSNLYPEDVIAKFKYQLIAPDKGAFERYMYWDRYTVVVADKVRNTETGKIESIRILNPELLTSNDKPLLVCDDLCDAGGTFVGLAAEIRKYTDKKLYIFVTHMVNRKGIENLSKVYDKVYFTNSYKNWENLPENCTQINVI